MQWNVEQKRFCPFCNNTYSTIEEAKAECSRDQDCNVIYDLFCDDVGYFCDCPIDSLITQTHARGIDCVHLKQNTP